MTRHVSGSSSPSADLSALGAPLRRSVRASSFLRSPSADLAYILGAWAAHTEVGTPPQRLLSFCARSAGTLAPLVAALTIVSGERPLINRASVGAYVGHRIRCLCPLLSDHLHDVTANNTRVPWEHLATRAEQQSYLRGLFDQAGWISRSSSPGLGLNKVSGLPLMEEIGRVFFRLGIYPLVLGGNLPSVRLRDRGDWVLFRREVGLSVAAERHKLDALCARDGRKRSYTVEEYQHVMHLHAQRRLSEHSIARATGVPANTVRDWAERGQVPRVVRRFSELQATEDASPDPAVISLLFREYGVSSELARRVAGRMALSDVQQALAGLPGRAHAAARDRALAAILQAAAGSRN